MWLFSALQSMRLCADAAARASKRKIKPSLRARIIFGRVTRVRSLVAQRLHRIEPGGARRRVQAGNQAHEKSENNAEYHQPQWHHPEMFGRKGLALEPDVGPEVDDLTD